MENNRMSAPPTGKQPSHGNNLHLSFCPAAAEHTNTRVAYYSIASLLVCVASGVWQLWYLRRFFQRKKLL